MVVKVVVDTFIYECGGDKGGDEGKSSSHFTNISIPPNQYLLGYQGSKLLQPHKLTHIPQGFL